MPRKNVDSESVQLKDRDLALLSGLFESRVMTLRHIATLHFNAKLEYTKKRLQKLKAAGFIREGRRHMNEPAAHFLTRKAFQLLAERGLLADYPRLGAHAIERRAKVSELTLTHELEVMDVRAAFHRALTESTVFSVRAFKTWPLLYQFKAPRGEWGGEIDVKPDGLVRIHEAGVGSKGFMHNFFLEVDRSAETQDRLISKAVSYREYYATGGFAVFCGVNRSLLDADPSLLNKYPFRVLIVCKTAERRNNAAIGLLNCSPPIMTMPCLTTMAELLHDPLGPIWSRPVDFQEALRGTPYENAKLSAPYRRDIERDALIEGKLAKCRLLH